MMVAGVNPCPSFKVFLSKQSWGFDTSSNCRTLFARLGVLPRLRSQNSLFRSPQRTVGRRQTWPQEAVSLVKLHRRDFAFFRGKSEKLSASSRTCYLQIRALPEGIQKMVSAPVLFYRNVMVNYAFRNIALTEITTTLLTSNFTLAFAMVLQLIELL